MKIKLLIVPILLFLFASSSNAQGLTYDEQIHDFGHVGIDFKVIQNFEFINRTEEPIKILKTEVTCDCTTVKTKDTLVLPGDTAFFKLTFDTKDYYGPINKSFTVTTDHPKLPELEYFYLSIVGQWFNGLKPKPISLFFLPSKKHQTIFIPNKAYDNISITSVSDSRNFSSSKIIKGSATKGNGVEVEVIPNSDLKSGNYLTTVLIGVKADDDEITFLSIPVKIVKY